MSDRPSILSIFGTRPEAIKMAPLIRLLAQDERFEAAVCVTAQHRRMLDQALDFFCIEPDFDLDIMTQQQSLANITCRVIDGLTSILENRRFDLLLVHGDTTTSFAATLAAFYGGVRVAHVEAGLRTGDLANPFPEEANRLMTDHLASLLFAPTNEAKKNLLREGHDVGAIHVTGNTIVDALQWGRERIAKNREPYVNHFGLYGLAMGVERKRVLITLHRRESFGPRIKRALTVIGRLAKRFADVDFVFPAHPNPSLQAFIKELLAPEAGKAGRRQNIFILPPQEYDHFLFLMEGANLVVTDSGGIQEETPSLGIPTLVVRERTERPEALQTGLVKLVGFDEELLFTEAAAILETDTPPPSTGENPFGDGAASERIVEIIASEIIAR